jgi:hypothetical protein
MEGTNISLLDIGCIIGIFILVVFLYIVIRFIWRHYRARQEPPMDQISGSPPPVPRSRPTEDKVDYHSDRPIDNIKEYWKDRDLPPASRPRPREYSPPSNLPPRPREYSSPPPESRPRPHPSAPRSRPSPSTPAKPNLEQAITRYPDVTLREKVALRQRCTLRVAVTLSPVKEDLSSYAMKFLVPIGEESINVDVLLTAEDFEIIGDDFRSLIIPVNRDSDPLIFEMVPQTLGAKKVKVEFFQNNKYIGGITTNTTVIMQEDATNVRQVSTQGIVGVEKISNPPDLTILITEIEPSGDRRRYKFKLHSPQNGLYFRSITEELVFTGLPSKWMESLYTEIATLSQDEVSGNLLETLSTIGSDLFEKLFPRELKEVWRKQISGKVKSIMIISDEPWIPWEIIKPTYETETGEVLEENFLCEDYQLTRWIAGSPPPSLLTINTGAIVAPLASNLPNVPREVAFLNSKLRMIAIQPRLNSVREFLTSGGAQLIHFACHGSFDPDEHEQSMIYLDENEKLRSRDIAGVRRNFGKDKPFVFINACQTARADFSLVGIGSWADKFVSVNSSGFLGSSWEVNDILAYEFASAFYQFLIDGKTIGEAVKEARITIKNEYDTTWLAYTVYADPLAKVVFDMK